MLHSVGLKTHAVPPGASNQQISQKFSKLPCTLPSATSGNMISQMKYFEHCPLWCTSGENDLVVHRYCTWSVIVWVLFRQFSRSRLSLTVYIIYTLCKLCKKVTLKLLLVIEEVRRSLFTRNQWTSMDTENAVQHQNDTSNSSPYWHTMMKGCVMAWWKAIVWLLAEFERCYTTQWSIQPIPRFHSHSHYCSCPHAVGAIQLQGVGWALTELGVILCLLFSSKHCQAASSLEKICMVSHSFWQGDFEKSHCDHLIGIHIDNYNGVADHFITELWLRKNF